MSQINLHIPRHESHENVNVVVDTERQSCVTALWSVVSAVALAIFRPLAALGACFRKERSTPYVEFKRPSCDEQERVYSIQNIGLRLSMLRKNFNDEMLEKTELQSLLSQIKKMGNGKFVTMQHEWVLSTNLQDTAKDRYAAKLNLAEKYYNLLLQE